MIAKTDRLHAELEEVRAANADNHLVPDEAIEYARANSESELHGHLTWDDTKAGVLWRRREMGQIIRAVYVVHNGNTQPVHAYWSPPSYRNGTDGYVHISEVRSDVQIAIEIAQDMLTRVRAANEDLLVAVDALPKLRPASRALGRAVDALQRVIDQEAPDPPARRPRRVPPSPSSRQVTGRQRRLPPPAPPP